MSEHCRRAQRGTSGPLRPDRIVAREDLRTGDCESCGRPSDDLAEVRRLYLDPDRPDGRPVAVGDTESWCFACRSLYPHEGPAPGGS